jgi:hypothetical protein
MSQLGQTLHFAGVPVTSGLHPAPDVWLHCDSRELTEANLLI